MLDLLVRMSRKRNVVLLIFLLSIFTFIAFNRSHQHSKNWKKVLTGTKPPQLHKKPTESPSFDEKERDVDLSHLDNDGDNEEDNENEEDEEGGKTWIRKMEKAKLESSQCGIGYEYIEKDGCQIHTFLGKDMMHINQQGTGIMYNNKTLQSWYYLKTRDNMCKVGEVGFKDKLEYEKVIILRSFRSNAWFHCFMETIPAFLMMKDLFEEDDRTKIFYSHITQKQLELIKMMGFDMSRVLHTDKAVFAQDVYFPIQKFNSCHFKLMRNYFKENFPSEAIPKPYFLLIQRRSRGLTLFDVLLEDLQKTFHSETFKVFTGSESMDETILLFKGAKAVIAPHGAGNANAFAFSPDNIPFLEVTRYKDSQKSGIWRQMGGAARALGFSYTMLLTELEGIDSMTEKELKRADFTLSDENIEEIKHWVRNVIDGKE